jgi:alanine transaminase
MSHSTLSEIANTEFIPSKPLTDKDLNPYAVSAKYAVRGKIPTMAEQLKGTLQSDPDALPFDKIIAANIGNPQQLDQKPITFYRQVLALIEYPDLLKSEYALKIFPHDAIDRANEIMSNLKSVGAYSHSKGVLYFRETVAKYIEDRDNHPSDPESIYLTAGASSAVNYLLNLLSNDSNAGFLIPIPQYPLYTASLAINNATVLPYYLNENENWSISSIEIEEIIKNAKKNNINPKCIVLINPGNPTGAVLTEETIAEILNISAKYGLVVIADEVYQENVYSGEFISVKKVLRDLQKINPIKYKDIQLASLHSTSKGMIGECGQRGGYMEIVGFQDSVVTQILKLASISLCPPVVGQALVSLMVNPPHESHPSHGIFHSEKNDIFNSLKERSHKLYTAFNKMEGVSCQEPQGAMYCFPSLTFSEKAKSAAADEGMAVDEFYCARLLNATGICTVPGSGFGQVPGTWHLRTTFLAPGSDWIDDWAKFHSNFMNEFRD